MIKSALITDGVVSFLLKVQNMTLIGLSQSFTSLQIQSTWMLKVLTHVCNSNKPLKGKLAQFWITVANIWKSPSKKGTLQTSC